MQGPVTHGAKGGKVMNKNTIFDSWNYLDNPSDGSEAWEVERDCLISFFNQYAIDGQVIMQGTVGR